MRRTGEHGRRRRSCGGGPASGGRCRRHQDPENRHHENSDRDDGPHSSSERRRPHPPNRFRLLRRDEVDFFPRLLRSPPTGESPLRFEPPSETEESGPGRTSRSHGERLDPENAPSFGPDRFRRGHQRSLSGRSMSTPLAPTGSLEPYAPPTDIIIV